MTWNSTEPDGFAQKLKTFTILPLVFRMKADITEQWYITGWAISLVNPFMHAVGLLPFKKSIMNTFHLSLFSLKKDHIFLLRGREREAIITQAVSRPYRHLSMQWEQRAAQSLQDHGSKPHIHSCPSFHASRHLALPLVPCYSLLHDSWFFRDAQSVKRAIEEKQKAPFATG